MGDGYIRLHRKTLEWRWFKDSNTVHVFLYCLLRANWMDGVFEGLMVKRGQLVTSLPTIAESTGLSIQNVRTALNHLRSTGEISDKAYSKYRVISVLNYEKYQDVNGRIISNQQYADKEAEKEVQSKYKLSTNLVQSKYKVSTHFSTDKPTGELTGGDGQENGLDTGFYSNDEITANSQLTGNQQATNRQLTGNQQATNSNIINIINKRKKEEKEEKEIYIESGVSDDTPASEKNVRKKAPSKTKAEKNLDLLTKALEAYSFSDTLVAKLSDWMRYKGDEKKDEYKVTGMKAFLSEVNNKIHEYGEQPVLNVINLSMANGWKGIIWDRIQTRQNSHGTSYFDFMREEVYGGAP